MKNCSPPLVQGDTATVDPKNRTARRILLVEDSPVNQELEGTHLEAHGYCVEVVGNGAEAVAACRKRRFDLVLMDLQMPEMDGLEAARQIRSEIPGYADVPILAMTADDSPEAASACRDVGMNDLITKPISRSSLVPAIARWLASDEGTSESQSGSPSPRNDEMHASAHAAPMDFERAVEEFGGKRALLDSLLDRFLEEVEIQIRALERALVEDDWETLRREAHKTRGGAANLAAEPLASAAEQIELSAEFSHRISAEEGLTWFEQEFERLKQFAAARHAERTEA